MISVGTVLHETYRIEGEIGRGGMGVVFRATHLRVPRAFAVKVLHPSIRDESISFSRFRREAEISSTLGHLNIIEVFDFNRTADGQAYFVMELLDGHSLKAEIERSAPLTPRRALEILDPVASALTVAHAAGIVHRDLKPSNIFLSKKGPLEIVKVLDFGVSKILGALDVVTETQSLVGTPAYMSPEQARGQAKHVDARSDQFSLASIAYEMLSGRRPFGVGDEAPFLAMYKIVNQEPIPLGDAPQLLRAVIAKALAKNPEDRFADVSTFAAALRAAIEGIPSTEDSCLDIVTLRSRAHGRRKAWIRAGLVAIGIATAAIAGLVPKGRRLAPTHAPAIPTVESVTLSPSAEAAAPAPAGLSLTISPPSARLVLVAPDGTRHDVLGPWNVNEPRAFRWAFGQKPAHARIEANGYEPSELSLPNYGEDVRADVHLVRRHKAATRTTTHPELSYPWPER